MPDTLSHRVGDIANIISLTITFAFTAAITASPARIFSAQYLRDGFCVSNPESPYFNSHALCFYVDTLATLACAGLLWYHGFDDPRLSRVRESFLGIFGHGLGHLALSAAGDGVSGATVSFSALLVAGIFVFWFAFFHSLTKSMLFNAALSVVNTIALGYIPRVFGFTYVQTVLMAAFVFRDLLTASRKDAFYGAWSVCVNVPVVIFGWMEGMFCEPFLVMYGGHLFYDAIIPTSMLAFSAISLASPRKNKQG
jgi:hypothetical protein